MRRSEFLLALAIIAAGALAQDAPQTLGRSVAATCVNCHGSADPGQRGVPSLAGVAKDVIVRRMNEFKSGARPATVMQQLAKGYTDEQIDAAAAWFASQKAAK